MQGSEGRSFQGIVTCTGQSREQWLHTCLVRSLLHSHIPGPQAWGMVPSILDVNRASNIIKAISQRPTCCPLLRPSSWVTKVGSNWPRELTTWEILSQKLRQRALRKTSNSSFHMHEHICAHTLYTSVHMCARMHARTHPQEKKKITEWLSKQLALALEKPRARPFRPRDSSIPDYQEVYLTINIDDCKWPILWSCIL